MATGLQNGPDGVRIVETSGGGDRFVDGLAYEGPLAEAGEGTPTALADAGEDLAYSLGRCPDGADTDDNADDFRLGLPTPGAVNECPDELNARAEPAEVIGGEPFALIVSTPVPVPEGEGDLALEIDVSPNGRVNCPADAVLPEGSRSVSIDCVAGPVPGDVDITVTAGALEAVATVTVNPLPAGQAGLVINEVDPDQPGGDNAEFVELLNTGNGAVLLEGLVIELVNGSNGDVYATVDLSGAGESLAAGGYLVVTNQQRVVDALPDGVLSLRHGAAMQNDADGLRLVDRNADATLDGMSYGVEIDNVTEGTEAPNDNGFVTSLARCGNGRDTDDNERDFSLTPPTPGEPNDCP